MSSAIYQWKKLQSISKKQKRKGDIKANDRSFFWLFRIKKALQLWVVVAESDRGLEVYVRWGATHWDSIDGIVKGRRRYNTPS